MGLILEERREEGDIIAIANFTNAIGTYIQTGICHVITTMMMCTSQSKQAIEQVSTFRMRCYHLGINVSLRSIGYVKFIEVFI